MMYTFIINFTSAFFCSAWHSLFNFQYLTFNCGQSILKEPSLGPWVKIYQNIVISTYTNVHINMIFHMPRLGIIYQTKYFHLSRAKIVIELNSLLESEFESKLVHTLGSRSHRLWLWTYVRVYLHILACM